MGTPFHSIQSQPSPGDQIVTISERVLILIINLNFRANYKLNEITVNIAIDIKHARLFGVK